MAHFTDEKTELAGCKVRARTYTMPPFPDSCIWLTIVFLIYPVLLSGIKIE